MPHPPTSTDQELHFFSQFLTTAPTQTFDNSRLSPHTFLQRLDHHGITLLALSSNKLPTDVVTLIGQRKAMLAANEQLKHRALNDLFDALQKANLEQVILFKGTALAYSEYPKPWLRPRSDTDCLINKKHKHAVENVLFQLGYCKKFGIEGQYISYQCTYSKRLTKKTELNIDLHWRINNRQILANAFHIEELLEQSQSLNKLSPNIRIPCQVDNILIAALHRIGHHYNDERLAWLYDIHLLAEKLDTQQWTELCLKAQHKGLMAITLDALLLCQQLFSTTIPSSVSQALAATGKQTELSRFFLNRKLPEWRYLLHDLKGLPKLKHKLRFIAENTLPNPDYIKQQMQTDSLIKGYSKRLWRGLKRIKHGQ